MSMSDSSKTNLYKTFGVAMDTNPPRQATKVIVQETELDDEILFLILTQEFLTVFVEDI